MPEAFHSRLAGFSMYFFLCPHPYSMLGNSGCTPCSDPVLSCSIFFAHILFNICHCSMGILSLEVNSR